MKYNILSFSQERLIENSFDADDAIVLATIKDMYASERMDSIIKDNKRYIWVNQEYLYNQIPIIGSIKKLRRILSKMCDNGFLDSTVVTNKKGKSGKFYYVKITEKLDSLSDYITNGQNDHRPMDKMTIDQWTKCPNKDSSINYSSINDSINTLSCKQDRTDNITKEVIDRLNDVAGTKYKDRTPKTKTLIQARLKEGFSLEDFNRVIDKKCREWSNTEMAKYLRPETLFGTKFESYLNQPDAIAVQQDDYFSHGRLV